MRKIIPGILLLSAVIFGASTAYSQCGSCIENYDSAYEEFIGSRAVFTGKVVGIKKIEKSKTTELNTSTDYYDFEVRFKVQTTWKNDSRETATILSTGSKNSGFKIGKSYLVYGYVRHYDTENLRAGIGCCSRTKLLSEAEDDLQVFKDKGEKPANVIRKLSRDNKKPTGQ